MKKRLLTNSSMGFLAFVGFLALAGTSTSAQEAEQYVPVLPKVIERMLPVDYSKGYLVVTIAPDVYVITDGIYQSMFVTTGEGVILFDAPPSFGQNIEKAVAEVTEEPIRKLVYSYAHVDHTAGAEFLKDIPDLEIIAEQEVGDFLSEMQDPRRLLPTTTFVGEHEIRFGSAQIELKKMEYHSNEGDLLIYLPNQRVLMAVDTFPPGYVPFMNFDLTMNMHAYLKMCDQLLAYDCDVLVPGHSTSLGTREDVIENKDYAMDVYSTVKRIHNGTDQNQAMMEVIEEYGAGNLFLIFEKVLDAIVQESYREIRDRWINRLAGVDVFGESHAERMMIYVRWDDKL